MRSRYAEHDGDESENGLQRKRPTSRRSPFLDFQDASDQIEGVVHQGPSFLCLALAVESVGHRVQCVVREGACPLEGQLGSENSSLQIVERFGVSAGGFEVGYYGDPEGSEFSMAYCQAVSENASIGSQSVLWSFQPFVGRSTRADAPADFAPQTPPCDGTVLGWQYAIAPQPPATDDFPRTPDVDTNLFRSEFRSMLWTP